MTLLLRPIKKNVQEPQKHRQFVLCNVKLKSKRKKISHPTRLVPHQFRRVSQSLRVPCNFLTDVDTSVRILLFENLQ